MGHISQPLIEIEIIRTDHFLPHLIGAFSRFVLRQHYFDNKNKPNAVVFVI